MIDVKIPLHSMEESVVRPIVVSVIQDILKLLGLPTDIYLQLTEDDKIKKKVNQLGELKGDNNNKTQWVYATWEEESEPEFELSTIPANPDFKPIWEDEDIGGRAMPVYHPRKLNIKFKYYTLSKSGIQSIINTLRVMTSNDGHTNRHDLEYFYNTGNYFTNLLIVINDLKNKRENDQNQLDLEGYIGKTFDDRVDLTYTLDGDLNKAEVVIREAQLECNGYIEDDVYNIQPNKEEEYNQWSVEFNYTLSYEKPISLNLRYPIMIYNTLLPERYRITVKRKDNRPTAYRTGRMSSIYKVVEKDTTLKPLTNNDFISIPKSDVVRLPDGPSIVSRLFCVLCQIDINKPTELFNINDIPGIRFKEDIKKLLLESEYPYVGDLLKSVFYIELYENEDKRSKIKVIMDKEGNLTASEPLDIKKTYRVMFNIMNNLGYLDIAASGRLTKYIKNQIDESYTSDPFNIVYKEIFNINTPYASQIEKMKYATEDIRYGLKQPHYANMKTKAWGHVIITRQILEEKK